MSAELHGFMCALSASCFVLLLGKTECKLTPGFGGVLKLEIPHACDTGVAVGWQVEDYIKSYVL